MLACVRMMRAVRPRWHSKEGVFQIVLSGLWLALSCYGFYHIYFYRLGRYGNDMLGMLAFIFIGIVALTSVIQLLFGRAVTFDGRFVRIHSLFGSKNISIRDITEVWCELPRVSAMDLLERKSNWWRIFKVVIGFDGKNGVLCEYDIGRGWNMMELKNFCKNVNEYSANKSK